ncbi:hypothetical protein C8Q80DRAFT_1276563 [Daedaleopsis nitida]|nr:hypothetical protein C8Q80DRAFT_1276563 [Daedaleopsis nitida]
MLVRTVILMLLVAVSGVSSWYLSARKCRGINPVVREEPLPSTIDGTPLPSCKTIALTGSSELTEYTCFMESPKKLLRRQVP